MPKSFASLDNLASGLSQQRPATAYVPPKIPQLSIPINLDSKAQAGGTDPLAQAYAREERARAAEYVRQQREQLEAREAEIYKREQAARDELRRRTGTTDAQPRITNRNPAWEANYKSNPSPKVSPASRPPTGATSGVSASTSLLDMPASAEARQAIKAPSSRPGAAPSNLPVAVLEAESASVAAIEQLAKGAAGSGLGAGAIDLGFRIAAGQPIEQAVLGGIAAGAGTAAGVVVGTAVAGPIGGFVGGAIGGFIGGRIADFIFAQASPSPASTKPDLKAGVPPFFGGQLEGIEYEVAVRFDCEVEGHPFFLTHTARAVGPISSVGPSQNGWVIGYDPPQIAVYHPSGSLAGHSINYPTASENVTNAYLYRPAGVTRTTILSVRRTDGQADTGGNPKPLPIPNDSRNPVSVQHPGNQSFSPPSAFPAAGRSDIPQQNNYVPGGLKNREGGSPRGDSPNWVPTGYPFGSIVNDNMPGLLMAPLPVTTENPASPSPSPNVGKNATSTLEPGPPSLALNQSFPRVESHVYLPQGPQITPSTGFVGEWSGGNFTSNPSDPLSQSGQSISSLPTPQRADTPPDAQKKSRVNQPTSTTQTNSTTNNQLNLGDINRTILEIGTGLVGITEIIKGLQNAHATIERNTSPDALRAAAAAGTCDTTKPGGCSYNMVNNAASLAAGEAKKGVLEGIKDFFGVLLAPIAALLEKVGTVVGVGTFPATVPATFIEAEGAVAATTTAANIPELMAWQTTRLDELAGQFEIPIEVPGGKKLRIPNMAEGIAELIGMGLVNITNSEMLLNLATKNIAESGQVKQQGFKTYMGIEAIIEYLGFKHKEVRHKLPLSFKPGETDLLSLLQDNHIDVMAVEFDDKLTQRTILIDLAQAAAITRARGFVKSKGATQEQIRDELIARIKHLDQYSTGLNTEKVDALGRDALDRLLHEIMSGYPEGQNPFACEGEEPPQITREKKTNNP